MARALTTEPGFQVNQFAPGSPEDVAGISAERARLASTGAAASFESLFQARNLELGLNKEGIKPSKKVVEKKAPAQPKGSIVTSRPSGTGRPSSTGKRTRVLDEIEDSATNSKKIKLGGN
tara:strand:+ start:266 stop:625 length:360 start_codon:yes stop_codon:yes gene_type:complete